MDGSPAPRTPMRLLASLEPIIQQWITTDDHPSPSSVDAFGPTEPDRPFPHFPEPNDGRPGGSSDADTTLALLLPLLILLSTLLFLLILFLVFLIAVRRRRGGGLFGGSRGIRLGDQDGPIDLSRDDEVWAEGEGGIEGMERRWLEQADEPTKIGYARAKLWQTQYPPNSLPTDITLSQFLSIQEKGVSAWSFEPDYDSNPSLPVFVQSRTEITFLGDGAGMAPEEGGGVCVMSNLPLPKLNEVYYWECKMYEKPEGTNVAVGLATKPYPSFRLPGWNRMSVGYLSSDGFKYHNYPFTGASYGPPLREGDVLGCGYRPRTGSVFFTRNGRKLDEAFVGLGLNRSNVFPTVGADNAAVVHVNLGQAGFVFIEANVKKWGLAPMAGTLAPPPAYGNHQVGSILLATGESQAGGVREEDRRRENGGQRRRRRYSGRAGADVRPEERREPTVPAVPSPLRSSSLGQPPTDDDDEEAVEDEDDDDGSDASQDSDPMPHNPPTPRPLDISLEEFVRARQASPEMDLSPRPSMGATLSPPSTSAAVMRGPERRSSSSASARRTGTGQEGGRRKKRRGQGGESRRERREGGSMSRPVSYEAATTSAAGRSPPGYSAIDPHKYAAGVAEAMLADHFPALASSSHAHPPPHHHYHQHPGSRAGPEHWNQPGGASTGWFGARAHARGEHHHQREGRWPTADPRQQQPQEDVRHVREGSYEQRGVWHPPSWQGDAPVAAGRDVGAGGATRGFWSSLFGGGGGNGSDEN